MSFERLIRSDEFNAKSSPKPAEPRTERYVDTGLPAGTPTTPPQQEDDEQ